MDLTPIPLGSDILVNTFTTSSQLFPSVTGLADGGFVVTWSSSGQDGSGYGIYGQRYDANGETVGGEFRINSYTTSDQDNSSVTALTGGGFVVTWSSSGQDGSGTGIYGQRYDASGTAVSGEFRVNSTTTLDQWLSSTTALANGGFVVTWTSSEQNGSGNEIFGQRYDASGSPAGGEFHVNTYTTLTQLLPSTTELADGGFVVTWTSQEQDGSGYGIFGQRYDAAGSTVGGEFQVNTYTTSDQWISSTTALADGGFVVIWTSSGQDGVGGGIYGQRYDASGSVVGGEFQVNTFSQSDQNFSSVTALADGGFLVAWTSSGQDGSGNGIFAQRYDVTGSAVGTEFQVNQIAAGDQGSMISLYGSEQLATLGDGRVIAVWSDTSAGDADIRLRMIDLPQDNTAPTITSNGGGDTDSGTIAENTTLVATVIATDADVPMQPLSYSISGGEDAVLFEIRNGNELHFINAPDYESLPSDGATQGYQVEVKVSDGNGGTDTQLITVTVANVAGATIDGDDNPNLLIGTNEEETINGFGGNDALIGLAGNDILNPGSSTPDANGVAFELIVGGAGNDTLNTGTGPAQSYVADYQLDGGPSGITVDLSAGTATDTFGDTDTLNGITFVISTNQADTLTGGATDDIFAPGGGADVIDGGDGTDRLAYYYIAQFDSDAFGYTTGITINHTADNAGTVVDPTGSIDIFTNVEEIAGTRFADTFNGGAGDDVFIGGDGTDTFNGGDGIDTVDYSSEIVGGGLNGISVDLAAGTAIGAYGEADVLSGIEGIVGTQFADTLTGDSGSNILIGGAGNDTLTGGGGSDSLTGGDGDDTFIISTNDASFIGTETYAGDDGTDTIRAVSSASFNIADFRISSVSSIESIVFATSAGASLSFSSSQLGGGLSNTLDVTSDDAQNVISISGDDSNETIDLSQWSLNLWSPQDFVTVASGDGADTILGTSGNDYIRGEAGDDEIDGSGGADTVDFSGNRTDYIISYDSGSDTFTVTDNRPSSPDGVDSVRNVETFRFNGVSFASVDLQNTAPSGTSTTITTPEDTAYTFSVTDFGFTDPNAGDELQAVRIDTLPLNGTLALSGITVAAGQEFAAADIGGLTFTPVMDANGTGYASFTFSVSDGALFSTAPNTLTIDVTSVNDAPVITSNGGGDASAVFAAENTTLVTSLSATDVDSSNLTFTITGGEDAALFEIRSGNELHFISAPNFELLPATGAVPGYQIMVVAADGAGGVDTQTLSVSVTDVNEPPSGTSTARNIVEDTTYQFSPADFGFSDPDAGSTFSAVRIDGLPDGGTMLLSGAAVSAGQVISVDDIGNLTFMPSADFSGSQHGHFQFSVSDGTLFDASPKSFYFNVSPVNDAPVITSNGGADTAPVSVAENTTLVTTLSATDVDSSNLTFTITGGEDAALFEVRYGNELHFVSAPDFEALPATGATPGYQVEVQVTDDTGGSDTQLLNVSVSDAADLAFLNIDKSFVSITDAKGGDGGRIVDEAGDVINYQIALTNTGDISLTNITLSDPSLDTISARTGDTDGDNELDVGETWTYSGTHVVSQAELDSGGVFDNRFIPGQYEVGVLDPNFTIVSLGLNAQGQLTNIPSQVVKIIATTEHAAVDIIYSIMAGTGPIASSRSDELSEPSIVHLTDSEVQALVDWARVGYIGPSPVDVLNKGLLDTATASSAETGPVSDSVVVQLNHAPVIVGGDTTSVTVAENTTVVGIVSGSDPDAAIELPEPLCWSIELFDGTNNAGADGSLFDIDPTTGQLSFKSSPDFENPSDSDANNTYEVTVKLADRNGGSDTQLLNVSVSDAADLALLNIDKSFVSITDAKGGDGGRIVDEAGDVINYQIALTNTGDISLTNITLSDPSLDTISARTGDTDGDNELDVGETWTYSGTHVISQAELDSGGVFDTRMEPNNSYLAVSVPAPTGTVLLAIDTNNGRLTTDVFTPSRVVAISATALGSVEQLFGESVLVPYSGIQTNDPSTVHLADAEVQALVEWTIGGYVGPSPIDVLNKGLLDTATASSAETGPVSDSVVVQLNHAPAIVGGDTTSITIAENTKTVIIVSGSDSDASISLPEPLSWSIEFFHGTNNAGADGSLFDIDPTTGQLSFKSSPDFENPLDSGADNTYEVTVKLSDKNGGTDTQLVSVSVTNLNDGGPVVAEAISASASEDTGSITVDLLAGATDPDNDALSVTNVSGLVAGLSLSGNSIIVDTAAFQNLGDGQQLPIPVSYEITDGALATSQTAVVTIIGVNDVASITGSGGGAVTEDGALMAGGMLSVSDVDSGENRFRTATASALVGTFGTFTFDAVSGAWDYSLNNSASIVQALNTGDVRHDTLTVTSLDGTAMQVIDVTINGVDDGISNGDSGGALTGTTGNDTIAPGGGNDIVLAGAGNDTIIATINDGSDVYLGGPGVDTVDYSAITAALSIRLGLFATSAQTGIDILNSIENVNGGSGNDSITGDNGSNRIDGGPGNDTINGGGGTDFLIGGAGNDTLNGGSGTDTAAFSGNLSDYGFAFASGSTTTVSDLRAGAADATDSISSIERLSFADGEFDIVRGSNGNNSLTGSNSATTSDLILGFNGNDTLNGRAGNDVLIGGLGRDTMTGGLGRDTFVFNALNETGTTSQSRDVITDFATGAQDPTFHDFIDLSGIDANTGLSLDQSFLFGGTASIANGVWYQSLGTGNSAVTIISGDVNGDLVADFEIQLAQSLTLQESDFIL